MRLFTLPLLLFLAAPAPAQEKGDGYGITADTVQEDSEAGVTTYKGNAKAEIASLVLKADRIAISHGQPLPSRIEAGGDPVTFAGQVSSGRISGTARKIILDVAERRLSLFDYAIEDPSGNRMKGKEARIILEP